MAASRFTVTGLILPEGAAAFLADDLLGIWELNASQVTSFATTAEDAATAANAVATSLPSGAADPGLIWRAELPASRGEAKSELEERLAAAEARQAYLKAAEKRISDLHVGLAYSAETAGAESALLAEVMMLRGSAVAYEPGDTGEISLLHLYEQCEALVARFRRLVQYYARVETSVGGEPVALTIVDWSGDHNVTWQDGIGPLDMALHMDSVRLVLATRQAWLRLISVVASGALSLSVKASVPGGQFLLFPAVYRFVRDVLAELEQVQVNQEAPG